MLGWLACLVSNFMAGLRSGVKFGTAILPAGGGRGNRCHGAQRVAFDVLTIYGRRRLGADFRRGARAPGNSAPGRRLAGVADDEMRLERRHDRVRSAGGLGMQDLVSSDSSELADRKLDGRERRQ